jgi:hypothetical protein
MKYYWYLALALPALFTHCKPSPSSGIQVTDQVKTTEPVPEGFTAFYEQFHRDSAFQMTHIVWPLPGKAGVQSDSVQIGLKDIEWQAADWHMHRLEVFNPNDYMREWQPIGDVLLIETIRARAVPFGIERRFAKRPDGEWELIYYADSHEFK